MTINNWVIKEINHPASLKSGDKTCPYFKNISSLASYSLDGECLAGIGAGHRLCTAGDIREYCEADYPQCPLYKIAAAGGEWEAQKEDLAAWPTL